jgi:hypothetical protein
MEQEWRPGVNEENEAADRLDAIQAKLDAATPGPWRWDENYGEELDTGLALTNDAGAEIVGAYNHHCCAFRDDPNVEDNDAEFIAASPENTRFLLDLARKQQAALEFVCDELSMAEAFARPISGNHIMSVIREALEAKP